MVFVKTVEPAMTVSVEKGTTVLTAIFANSAWIRSASDAVKAVRNAPPSARNAVQCAKTAATISSAVIAKYASNVGAEMATTAPSAVCVKCAWNMSAPAETDARNALTSAPNAARNVLPAQRKSSVSSADSALAASAVRAITAHNVDTVKTALNMSATAETDARNALLSVLPAPKNARIAPTISSAPSASAALTVPAANTVQNAANAANVLNTCAHAAMDVTSAQWFAKNVARNAKIVPIPIFAAYAEPVLTV